MKLKKVLTLSIAFVWFVNGFLCKILNLVTRHQEIVDRIINEEYSREITFTIGILEVFMVIWILSNYKSKLNAIIQIVIILSMNIIEFFTVSDLLFWGNFNIIFALLFSIIIYYNEFKINKKRNV